MLLKIIVLVSLGVILYCLFSGFYFLVKPQPNSRKVAIALTWRSALSVGLFSFLMITYLAGWVTPGVL